MNVIHDLLAFIEASPSAFHTVKSTAQLLNAGGFNELRWGRPWMLAPGGRYFTRIFGSTLIAFRIGQRPEAGDSRLKIAACHTDFPGFRVKPNPDIAKRGYALVNVSPYGGLNVSSWLDRPLSMAGKIVFKGKNEYEPEVGLIDFTRPMFAIPRLAPHLAKDTTKEIIDRQNDLTPIAGLIDAVNGDKGEKYFLTKLGREIHRDPETILSYDLNIYPVEHGVSVGMDAEMVSSPRLDNLTSAKACLDGIIDGRVENGIAVACFFDNEEVGSRTKQGADSSIIRDLLAAIARGLELDDDTMAEKIADGFLLSVDVAQGYHPCYSDRYDPTAAPGLGSGVIIKESASGTYASDAEAGAIVKGIAGKYGIPVAEFVNRSNVRGGSTQGSMLSAALGMRSQDIGVPILAMHSARELMAAKDMEALSSLLRAFFD